MRLEIRLLTWWRGQYVGCDAQGHKYYQDRKPRRDGRIHRWVVFQGAPEATKVSAVWHGWLHYTTDELPDAQRTPYFWEKPHQPNLTGTSGAYRPKVCLKTNDSISTAKSKADYEAWIP